VPRRAHHPRLAVEAASAAAGLASTSTRTVRPRPEPQPPRAVRRAAHQFEERAQALEHALGPQHRTSSQPSSRRDVVTQRRNGGRSSPQFATSTMAAGRSWASAVHGHAVERARDGGERGERPHHVRRHLPAPFLGRPVPAIRRASNPCRCTPRSSAWRRPRSTLPKSMAAVGRQDHTALLPGRAAAAGYRRSRFPVPSGTSPSGMPLAPTRPAAISMAVPVRPRSRPARRPWACASRAKRRASPARAVASTATVQPPRLHGTGTVVTARSRIGARTPAGVGDQRVRELRSVSTRLLPKRFSDLARTVVPPVAFACGLKHVLHRRKLAFALVATRADPGLQRQAERVVALPGLRAKRPRRQEGLGP